MDVMTETIMTRTKTKHILLYARIRRACLMHRAINNFYCRDVLRILRQSQCGLSVSEICNSIFGDIHPEHHSLTSRSLAQLREFKLVIFQEHGSHVIYRLNGPRIKKINTALRNFNSTF